MIIISPFITLSLRAFIVFVLVFLIIADANFFLFHISAAMNTFFNFSKSISFLKSKRPTFTFFGKNLNVNKTVQLYHAIPATARHYSFN